MSFKIGDKVIINTREVTPEDIESKLYYQHFAGLKGTVVKIYDGENCVLDIDRTSLPKDILKRHIEIEDLEKKRWLEGLSDEIRRGLTAEQKKYTLAYTVLINEKDLSSLTE